MTTYTPDCWVVLAIKQPLAKCATVEDSILHKIFATWRGGYLDGPSWKLNSGCERVVKDIYWYHVHGYSGSIYELHKDGYGLSAYSSGVLNNILDNHNSEGLIKLLSKEESLEYLEGACDR